MQSPLDPQPGNLRRENIVLEEKKNEPKLLPSCVLQAQNATFPHILSFQTVKLGVKKVKINVISVSDQTNPTCCKRSVFSTSLLICQQLEMQRHKVSMSAHALLHSEQSC